MCLLTAPNLACASETVSPWPYPRWIAHRGAGALAPENTLPAFERGAALGFRMFELDVRVSADGVVFLLHDSTLDRTTSARGSAESRTWSELQSLDAGAWHSADYVGTHLPVLHELLDLAHAKGWHLNIEIKAPTAPQDALTLGRRVAHVLQSHPSGQHHLVSSFDTEVLAGVQQQAPCLRRGYLLSEWQDDVLDRTQSLGCCALVLAHRVWTVERLQAVRSVKAWALAYTVNDEVEAQRLWAMGLDALITDRVDLFSPEG